MWQFTSETHFTKFLLACLNCTTVWNVLDTESTISKLVTFQLLLQTVISNNPHHLIGNRPCPLLITSVFIPKIQNHIIRSTPLLFLAIPATSSRPDGAKLCALYLVHQCAYSGSCLSLSGMDFSFKLPVSHQFLVSVRRARRFPIPISAL